VLEERSSPPADVRPPRQRNSSEQLAEEIRSFLIEQVLVTRRTPSPPTLGVVELTPGRCTGCFDSPDEAIVWDTGHQAYVHKLLTGRGRRFSPRLRQPRGLFRLPVTGPRESARPDREQPRLDLAVLRALGIAEGAALRAGVPGHVRGR